MWKHLLIAALMIPLVAQVAAGNGDCSDYIDLSGLSLPLTVTGTTAGATNDYGPFPARPECWQGERWRPYSAEGADVTYKWTAPAAGEYTFTLCDSEGINSDLLLFEFTCPTEPVYPDDFICGNDAGCAYNALLKNIPLAAGQEILIVVDEGNTPVGPFELGIHASTGFETTIEVLMDVHHLPGVSACLVGTDGILWDGAFGMADLAAARPVTDSTLFYIASVSKPVAAAALMQLHDAGRFALDDPIQDHLPFPVVHPFHPDSIMTFRMLLSHVAGIDDNWPVMTSVEVCDMDSPIPLGEFLEEYLTPGGIYYDAVENFTLHAPGTAYAYSNIGASLVGYLVESIASATQPGTTLEDYSQQHLFAPLGMGETSWQLSGVGTENLAVPYAYDEGQYVPYCHLGIPWYPPTLLRTSPKQLARFLGAFMRGGEIGGARILESATVDTILTPHYPELYDYGLHWSWEEWLGRWTWGHGGNYYGTRTFMWFFPEDGLGGVVFTNGESTRGMWDIAESVMEYGFAMTTRVAGSADPPSPGPAIELRQCEPNPGTFGTSFPYVLGRAAPVSLELFDVTGRMVRVLRASRLDAAGPHVVRWDGRDERGRVVASGVYFYRLRAAGGSATRKMIWLR